MTIHKPCSLQHDSLLSTELVTAILYNQCGCNDMNRVGSCNPLILFFSRNNTQLRSILRHRIHVLNGLGDMVMNTVTYTAKKGIKPLTLNHLVKGSNPLRPIDSTAIQDFTLDRFLDRLENHLEANHNAYKNYRNSGNNGRGVSDYAYHELGRVYMTGKVPGETSAAPCQPTHATHAHVCRGGKVTNHQGHIKLWDELAKTGSGNKYVAFQELFPELDQRTYGHACFACVEDSERMTYDGDDDACDNCPITDNNRSCANGFYSKWNRAKTKKERKRLAAIIRDLPWREK